MKRKKIYQLFVLSLIVFCCTENSFAADAGLQTKDSTSTSTQQAAIAFIEKITELHASNFWPNVKPAIFLQNIKKNIPAG